MRFHVLTDARYIDGEVAAGKTLAVYDDSAGSTASTLYTTATGAVEAANPYTVPATGVYVPLITAKNRTWRYLLTTHIHPETNPNLRRP